MIRHIIAAICGAGLMPVALQIAPARSLADEVNAVAALPGEPRIVSAAGITRSNVPLLTIENPGAFETGAKRRLVIVGGLGDDRSGRAALNVVRWFKTDAPAALREKWVVSAIPVAQPDGGAPLTFPPDKGFFDDPRQPESRYLWRWIAYQAPDLVAILHGGDTANASLATALAGERASGLGAVRAFSVPEADAVRTIERAIAGGDEARSPLREAIVRRIDRAPIDIARLLARRYPETPAMSYIPAVAWTSALRLAAIIGDDSLRARVRRQIAPWISGERKPFGCGSIA